MNEDHYNQRDNSSVLELKREHMEHTATPYRIEDDWNIIAGNNILVAGCGGHADNFTPNLREQKIANTHFIVRACNSHKELLEACKGSGEVLRLLLHRLTHQQKIADLSIFIDAEKQAMAAIAKAGG